MFDLQIRVGSFDSTSAQVAAVSEAGRRFLADVFGAGAVGCEMPQSQVGRFVDFAAERGVRAELNR